MGDSGEGLVDAEGRIQERMEELARERARKPPSVDPDAGTHKMIESLRLARVELARQGHAATNPRRKAQLTQALEDIDRRMSDLRG